MVQGFPKLKATQRTITSLSIHLALLPSIHSTIHPSIYPLINPSAHPSIHPSIVHFINSFTYTPSIHLPMHPLPIYPSIIHLSIIHPLTNAPSINLFTYASIYTHIYSCTHYPSMDICIYHVHACMYASNRPCMHSLFTSLPIHSCSYASVHTPDLSTYLPFYPCIYTEHRVLFLGP